MFTQATRRSLFVVGAALCMAESTAFLSYTDELLAYNGVGAPESFGYSVTGNCVLWLQPWLLAAAQAGLFQGWDLSLSSFLGVGLFSGVLLAGIAGFLVRRLAPSFWPVLVVFCMLAVSSAAYASRNYCIFMDARSGHNHG